MRIISSSTAQQGFRTVTRTASAAEVRAPNDEFQSLLSTSLGASAGQEVSEEDLFAALVHERIHRTAGQEVAQQYLDAVQNTRGGLQRSRGRVSEEDAAREALRILVEAGRLERSQADALHDQAFRAAQLDDNGEALYDSIAGPGDATRAVAELSQAIERARATLEKLAEGSEELVSRGIETASNSVISTAGAARTVGAEKTGTTIIPKGTVIDGSDGFLFKPISANQGTLAILLPASMTGAVLDVLLRDDAGHIIERGRHIAEGTSETGREKYSFSKPGGAYPERLTVEVHRRDGTVDRYKIADPSQRYD